jgi:hypothetical protein
MRSKQRASNPFRKKSVFAFLGPWLLRIAKNLRRNAIKQNWIESGIEEDESNRWACRNYLFLSHGGALA